MSGPNAITLLGRFLTRKALRSALTQAPAAVEAPVLGPLSAPELERQAETLLKKRFAEIQKWMPVSLSALGPSGYRCFEEYADTYWPSGHHRHLLDAVEFGKYLLRTAPSVLNRAEFNFLYFRINERKGAAHFVADFRSGLRSRWGLQIFYKRKPYAAKQWFLYFGRLILQDEATS